MNILKMVYSTLQWCKKWSPVQWKQEIMWKRRVTPKRRLCRLRTADHADCAERVLFPFLFGAILISRNTKVNKQDSWQSTSGIFSIRLTVLCETKWNETVLCEMVRVHIRNKHFTWLHNIFAVVFRYWLSALLRYAYIKIWVWVRCKVRI